jgi:hypothetical protein
MDVIQKVQTGKKSSPWNMRIISTKFIETSEEVSRIRGCSCCEDIFTGSGLGLSCGDVTESCGCIQISHDRICGGFKVPHIILILTDNRHKLIPENREKITVTNCKANYSLEEKDHQRIIV